MRKSSGGNPPFDSLHSHLCPIAHTDRGTFSALVSPESTAATMSQCSSAVANRPRLSGLWRSQWSSLANPHSDE